MQAARTGQQLVNMVNYLINKQVKYHISLLSTELLATIPVLCYWRNKTVDHRNIKSPQPLRSNAINSCSSMKSHFLLLCVIMKTNALIFQAEMQLMQKNDPGKRLTDKDQSIPFLCVCLCLCAWACVDAMSAESVCCKVHIHFSWLSIRICLSKERLFSFSRLCAFRPAIFSLKDVLLPFKRRKNYCCKWKHVQCTVSPSNDALVISICICSIRAPL